MRPDIHDLNGFQVPYLLVFLLADCLVGPGAVGVEGRGQSGGG